MVLLRTMLQREQLLRGPQRAAARWVMDQHQPGRWLVWLPNLHAFAASTGCPADLTRLVAQLSSAGCVYRRTTRSASNASPPGCLLYSPLLQPNVSISQVVRASIRLRRRWRGDQTITSKMAAYLAMWRKGDVPELDEVPGLCGKSVRGIVLEYLRAASPEPAAPFSSLSSSSSTSSSPSSSPSASPSSPLSSSPSSSSCSTSPPPPPPAARYEDFDADEAFRAACGL